MGQATSCQTMGSRSQRRGYSRGPNNRPPVLSKACLQTMDANRSKPAHLLWSTTTSTVENIKDNRPTKKFPRHPKQPKFTVFLNLPQDIQVRIWKLAIPVTSPRLFLEVTWWDIGRQSPFARPPWPIRELVITNKQTKAVSLNYWKDLAKVCHTCQNSRNVVLAFIKATLDFVFAEPPFLVDFTTATFGFTMNEIHLKAYEEDGRCGVSLVPKVKHLLVNGLMEWTVMDPFFYVLGVAFDDFKALESVVFFHSWKREKLAGRMTSFTAAWTHHFAILNKVAENATKCHTIRLKGDQNYTESPPTPHVDRRVPTVAFVSMDGDGNAKFVYMNTGDDRIPELFQRLESAMLPKLQPRGVSEKRRLNHV